MAPWGDAKLFFCILFVTCCCMVTLAEIPMDCCLMVKNKTIPHVAVVDHFRQIAGQGCSVDAMILVSRQDIKLCVPADEPWVQEVVKHVDGRKRHCKRAKYQGRRCIGMKHE
ncbi:C-C motif chemokine 19-like [Symphorus nematophorus]